MSEITNLISVEPTSILFPHTYISSISRLTIKIINNGRQNVHFEWRKYASEEQEKNILETTDNSNVEERQKYADILMFSSSTFKFIPDKGEIWESRSQDFMVDFTPELAQIYDDNAYLYIIETGQRIHLPIHGQGLPPDARFNIDAINIGHVTLESILEYKVKLINVGRVGVDFSIDQRKNSNCLFQFTPDHGHIPIDQSIFINVKFTANAVGPFNEVFTFLIKGATQFHPTLSLYGRVIGPSFALSTKSINFNTISFGFLYSQTFEIENKSQIPFDFTLRLLQDGSFSRREFIITPTTGTIGKYSKQQVQLEFIPTTIKKYNLELHLDIAKYAQSLAVIPIVANCICPDVTIENPEVDLGDVFIGHSYQSLIKLVDNSEYPAKYEFATSNDTTQLQAQVTVPKPNGAIDALKSTELNFSFKPIQLGPIRTEQYVKIYGSKDPPLPFTIKAVCTGPDLFLSSQNISFGSIPVLKNIPFHLKIQNKSLIPAPYKANITSAEGVFKVMPDSGNILPNATVEMTIVAYLDDNAIFRGKLNLLFENLNPIVLDIKANGTGSPILASIDMSKIPLGYIFTERPVVKKITFENKGRKPESVRWNQQKPKIVDGPATANCTFKVSPDQLTMQPHESQEFTLVFQSDKPVSFAMNLQISTMQKRKRVDLFTPEITGTFIAPIVKISKQQLDFKHYYDVKKELEMTNCKNLSPEPELMQPMTQTLKLTNESKLPLRIFANCPAPFYSSLTDFTLELAETKEIDITFDPSFKTDYISETVLKKLVFSFKGHPSTYKINLKGTCEFPNLAFIPPEILNFGIMMMNTEQSKDVEVQNVSDIPADYEWQLLPSENGVDMSKIFDIYPMRSHLDPGQKEITRFSFFSMINDDGKSAQYQGNAVCHIVGGPEYLLSLKGGSTDIRYKIDPLHFDLGSRGFKETLNESFTITNLSDAPIPFSIKIPRSCKFLSISFDPMEGTLGVNQTTKVNFTIVGGLPLYYIEQFFVQIGHFEDVRVDIDVRCYIPQIKVDLERLPNDPLLVSYIEHTHSKEPPTDEELAEYDSKLYIQRQTERLSLMQTATIKTLKSKKKKNDSIRTYDRYVSSRYLVDFGTIVFGRIEKKDITFKNITPFPISFEIYTDSLNGTGFSINPSSFQDIPQNEEITITISFDNQKRLNELIGNVELELPIVFTNDLGSMLHLRANLTMPVLNFSDMHFNFGNVIVGQSKVMTLQLQNMNIVNCEFSFKEAQHTNVLQRSMAQGVTPVFTASPASGLLPPSSFQNIEITFSPRGDKNYSMQFPVSIKHNTQETFITMRGTGIQLKVTFDPPHLILPPLNPFSEPTQKEVTLTNQTDYPIELMAPQFDLQLAIDAFLQQNPDIEKTEPKEAEESMAVTSSNTHVTKFSICVIVSGSIKSGKTTVSKIVSEYLNNAPIVVLKDVWKDLLENPEATQEDYVSTLTNYLNRSELAEGFVIDGLDSLPEPAETDQFIAHTMKSKNNDTTKNPFLIIPHSNVTAAEQALQYVLDSLDGHYVFHIALNAPEEIVVERDEKIKAAEKEEKQKKNKEAKEALFLMTEDQYMALTEEEKEEVDQKRQNLRAKLLKSALESDENPSKEKRSHSSSSGSHKHHRHRSKDESGDSKEKSDKKVKSHKSKSSLEEKPPEEPPKENKKKKQTTPTEPIPKSVAIFKYTLGTIVQKIQTPGSTFQVVDPHQIFEFEENTEDKAQTESNLKPEKNSKSTEKLIDKVNDANNENSDEAKSHKKSKKKESDTVTQIEADENELLVTNLANPHVNEEEENFEENKTVKRVLPSFAIPNVNTLLIEIGASNEEIKNAITTYLPNIQQLEEKSFTRLIPEPRTILPVVKYKKGGTSTPLFFSIIGEEVPEEDDTSQLKLRPDSHSQKMGRKSRASAKKEPDPLQEYLDELDTSKYTRRWLIEPKSQKTMTIQFSAELIGLYKDIITFQLVNGKSDPFKLNVSGECSYPDIDRSLKTIFPKRVPKLDSKTEFAYALDVNEFHFGSLLVVKDKGKAAHYRQYIVLQNVSKFPVEFNAMLSDKQAIWSLESTSGVINVDETYQLYFGISPTVPNLYRNQLLIFIKDHPDPLNFKLVAEACQPMVDISDTILDFDKLLLTQSKKLTLHLKNSGKLPAFWRLKNTNTLGENFTFSSVEGVLKPRGSTTISVNYASTKPLSVKKPITFEVLDMDKVRVFITKQIQVSAESFDVNFDFQYPKGLDHLQYGSLKVGQTKTIPCVLVNKGKYPSNYVIAITLPKIESMFVISQAEGTLLPNKPLTVNFTIATSAVSKFKNYKAITLTVTDNTTNTTTATLSLPFSVESFYSTYEIEPKKQIPFGPIPINQNVSKSISIANKGIFAFEYEIIPAPNPIVPMTTPAKGNVNTANVPASKKASPQKVQKGGAKRSGEKSIAVGSYTISPPYGIIQPGTTQNVDIDYFCTLAGKSRSVVKVKISDTNPKKFVDNDIVLSGESYIPGLNTTEFDKIFPNTLLCLKYDLPKITQNAFLEDELLYHFAPLILQQKSTVTINLINPYPISCTVDISLTQKQKTAKNVSPFDVDPKQVDIQPNSSSPVKLTFVPVTCDKFTTGFEAVVRGGTDPITKILKFQIEGSGTLPSISLLSQLENKGKSNNYSVNLGKVLVGFNKDKTIALKNDGLIPTKLAITAKLSPDFQVVGFDSLQDTTLDPGHILNIPVIYAPQKVRKDQIEINVSVPDNPKASLSFAFSGEGFSEDIIFEGLSDDNDLNFKDSVVGKQQVQTFRLRNVSTDDLRFSWVTNNDFSFSPKNGHLKVGMSKAIAVTFMSDKPVKYNALKCNCQWTKIKLEDPNSPDWDDSMTLIKFVPRSTLQIETLPPPEVDDTKSKRSQRGSVKGKNSKNKLAKPSSPSGSSTKHPKDKDSESNESSDQALSSLHPMDDEIVKVVEIKPEPAYESLFQKPKDLLMKINAIADYIKYQIDTTEIAFTPTMMFQTRTSDVKVTNPSSIRFEYSWIISNFKCLRANYAPLTKPTFSVQPSSGYIEPNQSVVFKVKFHPEEVDDFTADLKMEIPFLTQQEPPKVALTGFSRRPLCHFNVEMSDYLTAGRRHPDFTEPLPPDCKVIELFSPHVGAKRFKRFEIINPTSSPYEIVWTLKSNPDNLSIVCDSENAFVSSGKRYSASFSYTPTSPKTVEVLWEFSIPEHGITVPFLTVGRVMPNVK